MGLSSVGDISEVLNGKTRTAGGYFWRPKGSLSLPREDLNSKPVEKICMETKQILESFSSIVQAAKSVNESPSSICHVLAGRQRTCYGYFWRRKGSKSTPPPRKRVAREVEKLCFSTRDVLETYISACQAAEALGVSSPGYIYDAIKGKIRSYKGSFWRFKGTDDTPRGSLYQRRD
jgi:hypothetical protein